MRPLRCLCLALLLAAVRAEAIPLRRGIAYFHLGEGREAVRSIGSSGRSGPRVSWSLTGFSAPPEPPIAFAVTRNERLVALTEVRAFYCDDGLLWSPSFALSSMRDARALAMDASGFGAVVTGSTGVWATRDAGETWQPVSYWGPSLEDVELFAGIAVYSDVAGGVGALALGSLEQRTLCAPAAVATPVFFGRGPMRLTVQRAGCEWELDPQGHLLER